MVDLDIAMKKNKIKKVMLEKKRKILELQLALETINEGSENRDCESIGESNGPDVQKWVKGNNPRTNRNRLI